MCGRGLFLFDYQNQQFKAMVVHEPYFFLVPEDKTLASRVMGGDQMSSFMEVSAVGTAAATGLLGTSCSLPLSGCMSAPANNSSGNSLP